MNPLGRERAGLRGLELREVVAQRVDDRVEGLEGDRLLLVAAATQHHRVVVALLDGIEESTHEGRFANPRFPVDENRNRARGARFVRASKRRESSRSRPTKGVASSATSMSAAGTRLPVGAAGTITEWPNWSLALESSLEEIEEAELPRRIARRLTRS